MSVSNPHGGRDKMIREINVNYIIDTSEDGKFCGGCHYNDGERCVIFGLTMVEEAGRKVRPPICQKKEMNE